jgi:hypothetical protein
MSDAQLFDDLCRGVLLRAYDAYLYDLNNGLSCPGLRPDFNDMTLAPDISNPALKLTGRVNAHLIERGFLNIGACDIRGVFITAAGIQEYQRLSTPTDPRAQLLADIAYHDAQVAAKRAALVALGERNAMTEAGIMRLIGDSLQNGE